MIDTPDPIDRIRRRLELSYPWSHTDFRHDGTPVFTQMGNPVEDLRCVMQELDQTRQFESEIRALLLGGERDDPNQPTEILAENVSRLWKRATAELAQTRHLYANLTRCTVCDVLPGVKLSSGNADKCFRCDGTGFCTEKQAAAPLTILKLENELAQTRLRLDAMTGERAADDERLRQAGARVGIWYGCDTPDWLAEEILGLRARLDALEAENQRLTKALQHLENTFRPLVDSELHHYTEHESEHHRAIAAEKEVKALQAQLTLAESSRASLEAERDTYRAACVAMHNGYVGAGNAGMHRADLIQEGIRLFDQVEATRGIGHADDVAEILSWRTQLETLTPPSSPSAQEPTKS